MTDRQKTKGDSLHFRWSLQKTLRQDGPTAGCIASIYTIRKQQECTGIYIRTEHGIMKNTKKSGTLMPAAIAVGGDPAVIYSASAPLPEAIDEMLFAGFLRKAPVEMVKCITMIFKSLQTANLSLRVILNPERHASRGHSETTQVFTLPQNPTLSFM